MNNYIKFLFLLNFFIVFLSVYILGNGCSNIKGTLSEDSTSEAHKKAPLINPEENLTQNTEEALLKSVVNAEIKVSSTLEYLKTINKSGELLRRLEYFSQLGKIGYGSSDYFNITRSSNIFIFIIDDRDIIDLLKLNQHIDQTEHLKEEIKIELKEQYKGKRAIWIQSFEE